MSINAKSSIGQHSTGFPTDFQKPHSHPADDYSYMAKSPSPSAIHTEVQQVLQLQGGYKTRITSLGTCYSDPLLTGQFPLTSW